MRLNQCVSRVLTRYTGQHVSITERNKNAAHYILIYSALHIRVLTVAQEWPKYALCCVSAFGGEESTRRLLATSCASDRLLIQYSGECEQHAVGRGALLLFKRAAKYTQQRSGRCHVQQPLSCPLHCSHQQHQDFILAPQGMPSFVKAERPH